MCNVYNQSCNNPKEDDYAVTEKDGMHYVEVAGINPQDYCNAITLTATKGGTQELYESGYTGILSWVNGVTFDFQIQDFQGEAVAA